MATKRNGMADDQTRPTKRIKADGDDDAALPSSSSSSSSSLPNVDGGSESKSQPSVNEALMDARSSNSVFRRVQDTLETLVKQACGVTVESLRFTVSAKLYSSAFSAVLGDTFRQPTHRSKGLQLVPDYTVPLTVRTTGPSSHMITIGKLSVDYAVVSERNRVLALIMVNSRQKLKEELAAPALQIAHQLHLNNSNEPVGHSPPVFVVNFHNGLTNMITVRVDGEIYGEMVPGAIA